MPTTAELLARITVPKAKPTKYRSILLEGGPGTGKTHYTLHMPGPILCIYTDNNRATLEALREHRDDIHEVEIQNWQEDFDPFLLNKLKNRELDIETVIVDGMSSLFNVWVAEKKLRKPKFTHDEWGDLLNLQTRVTHELTNLCRPRESKPSYNFVATCLLQDKINEKDGFIKYEPMILGGFRSAIESKFDYVLLSASETQYVSVLGESKKVRKRHTFIRTVSPDNYHFCKTPTHWPARVANLEEILKLIDNDLTQQTNNK